MKIALLGYGAEARSAYHYFRHLYPDGEFVIYDNATTPKFTLPEEATFRGGVKEFHGIDADIVVRTPAISPAKVSSRGKITSVTKEFFEVCPVPIIGVSGTKGKGTTASLITAILQKAGIKTWLVGNIGLPAFDMLDEIRKEHQAGHQCIVVYELSSFQLWDMTQSPHIAVLLMIEPEHLDVHADFSDYVQAKSNLVKHQNQNDIVIYYAENETTAILAQQSIGKKIPYKIETGDQITVDNQVILSRSDIILHGAHNVGNVQAAILAVWQYVQDIPTIRKAIQEFKGLPHRLEEVAHKNDILFINDSFSSAPPATLAAASSFTQPEIVLMGGYDRGLDFKAVVGELVKRPNIKKILLIGATKQKIAKTFDEANWHDYEVLADDLKNAVKRASDIAAPGDVIILSPGCPSFDMFKDFTERGNTYKQAVMEL